MALPRRWLPSGQDAEWAEGLNLPIPESASHSGLGNWSTEKRAAEQQQEDYLCLEGG